MSLRLNNVHLTKSSIGMLIVVIIILLLYPMVVIDFFMSLFLYKSLCFQRQKCISYLSPKCYIFHIFPILKLWRQIFFFDTEMVDHYSGCMSCVFWVAFKYFSYLLLNTGGSGGVAIGIGGSADASGGDAKNNVQCGCSFSAFFFNCQAKQLTNCYEPNPSFFNLLIKTTIINRL